ncbi:MAG TPA: universal stress protein [Actinophytocola sp.]|nr:universal stress protein [Actinophytocola sp.]
MGGGAADPGEPARAYEPKIERFGPRPASGRTILVGVDGSDTAMRAAAYAFGLARRQGCRLFVAFVAERSSLALTGTAAAFEHGTWCELHADLGAEIRAAAEELGVPVTYMMVHGDPVNELRDAADCCHADTVVVGASTSAGHRFAGSVATRLIRTGRWPVLVVP